VLLLRVSGNVYVCVNTVGSSFTRLMGTDKTVTNTRTHFMFMWPCILTNFLIIKPTRCTNFWNLFRNETLHVSDSSSVHHQEFFTVHLALVYVIRVCKQLSSRLSLISLFFHSVRLVMNMTSDTSSSVYNLYIT
jgi:hypothetical protein